MHIEVWVMAKGSMETADACSGIKANDADTEAGLRSDHGAFWAIVPA